MIPGISEGVLEGVLEGVPVAPPAPPAGLGVADSLGLSTDPSSRPSGGIGVGVLAVVAGDLVGTGVVGGSGRVVGGPDGDLGKYMTSVTAVTAVIMAPMIRGMRRDRRGSLPDLFSPRWDGPCAGWSAATSTRRPTLTAGSRETICRPEGALDRNGDGPGSWGVRPWFGAARPPVSALAGAAGVHGNPGGSVEGCVMGGIGPSDGAMAPSAALPGIPGSSVPSLGKAGWVSGLARPPTTAVICVRRRSPASFREQPNKSNDTIPPRTSGRRQFSMRTGTRRRRKPWGSAR